MNGTDSTPIDNARRARRSLIRAVPLGIILTVVLGISYAGMRSAGSRQAQDVARLSLESMIQARQVYSIERSGVRFAETQNEPRRRQVLLSDLRKIVELHPDRRSIRRLALMQRALSDPGWKTSLAKLRDLPRRDNAFEAERELAMWDEILEGKGLRSEDIPTLRTQISAMDLGWYEHLALESLYANAGMNTAAAAESRAAQRSATGLILFWRIGEAVARAGLGAALGLAGFLYWRRRNPDAGIPSWLKPSPPGTVTRAQSDVLYFVFLSYLGTYAVLRSIAVFVIQPHFGHGRSYEPVLASVSLALSLGAAIVPFLVFKKLGGKLGLNATNLGLRSSSLGSDILWGVAGYAMALPLVWIATAISAFIFRGHSSPLHPAIAEFTGTHNIVTQIILLTQAAILAPMVEECLFRGVFFRSLAPRVGWISAVFATSAIFAVLHPQLPFGFLGLFVLGSVFNLLFELRGSLVPAIVAHSINNATIFFFAYLIGA